MKRTRLERHTPLSRKAMSPRRTPLRRSTKRLGLWSPSRPRVTPEERRARDLVRGNWVLLADEGSITALGCVPGVSG